MGNAEDGVPTDETDALWEDLYQCKQFLYVYYPSSKLQNSNTNMHISKDGVSAINSAEAAKLPNRTSAIPSSPNQFVVELDVFHQIHCLNALRKTLYPERYKREFHDYFDANGQRNYTSSAAHHYGTFSIQHIPTIYMYNIRLI